MRRDLEGGYELDDDPARVDVAAVYDYLANESYWAKGRPLETVTRLIREAHRIVGLYHEGAQVGFCRAHTDGVTLAYLADVYVLPEHQGRGLGTALVTEMVDGAPFANIKWVLHTSDGHGLYRKLGFGEPSFKLMERQARAG
jgi:GNAT superfamily N-acetyltransferase